MLGLNCTRGWHYFDTHCIALFQEQICGPAFCLGHRYISLVLGCSVFFVLFFYSTVFLTVIGMMEELKQIRKRNTVTSCLGKLRKLSGR